MTEVGLRTQIMLDAGVSLDPLWQGRRITQLLNQAQDWLQMKLIKQGTKNWKKSVDSAMTASSLFDIVTARIDLPVDFLYDMPVDYVTQVEFLKPASEIDYSNFEDIVENPYTTPNYRRPAFVVVDTRVHLYPKPVTIDARSATLHYTRKVTDLVYDNNSTACEIPIESQPILIERVVMQIKSAMGAEDIKQAKRQEIDAYIAEKYQLDQAKKEDRKIAQ